MKNNGNYGLLDGLFSTPTTTASKQAPAEAEKNTTASKETKRTWKIKDDLWEDFVALVATSGLTQAEYINKLIADAIEENRAKIEKYKEITKK